MFGLQPHLMGIGYAVVGYTLWVVVDALMKIAAEAGAQPFSGVMYMSLASALVLVAVLGGQKKISRLKPQRALGPMIMAFMGLISNACNVVALKHLPLTLFYICVFTVPLTVALLSHFLLNEKLEWKKSAAIIIGFLGVVVAINPTQHIADGDVVGYLAAFASAAAFAVFLILGRKVAQKETAESLAFINALVCFVAAALLAYLFGETMLWSTQLLIPILVAGALNVFGNLASYLSLHFAPASTVTPFHYTQIISGAFVAYCVWGDVPTLCLVAGAGLIIGSGLYIVMGERYKKTA